MEEEDEGELEEEEEDWFCAIQTVLLSTRPAWASVAAMPACMNLDASSTTRLRGPATAPLELEEDDAAVAQAGSCDNHPPRARKEKLEVSSRRAASSLACSMV